MALFEMQPIRCFVLIESATKAAGSLTGSVEVVVVVGLWGWWW